MGTDFGGYMGKVIMINLSDYNVSEYPWSDEEREMYLGGKIMAAKVLLDNIKQRIDPFSPDNILAITTGPLTGTGAPSSSRFNISTLSPLTGFIASSNCGGDFGLFLKKAGYDALIITGKAKEKIWIEITDQAIEFHNADELWGKTTGEAQNLLGKNNGKIVIGPAGENLVRYASIFSGERAAGRAGVGAVMGSKNLKAVTAKGNLTPDIYNKEKTKLINKQWIKKLKEHPITGERLPKYGTAGFLRSMNSHSMLATRNYKYGEYKDYEKLSGEYLAEHYLIKNRGCITCPIQCGRLVEVDGKKVKGPELETLGLLGSNIENNNMELIMKWNLLLDELGMDTITTGSTLAFAMELREKGLWENGLEFGRSESLENLIKDIAYRKGIGDFLAEGTKRLSEKFGGHEFAMQTKGLELAAYEPRGAVGQGLGYAVSNRGGCHLNGGYTVLFEGLGLEMDPYTNRAKAALTVMFQNIMEAVSAGGNCLFTLFTAIPASLFKNDKKLIKEISNLILKNSGSMINLFNKLPARLLRVNLSSFLPHAQAIAFATGMKMDIGKFKEIGERGYNLERLFNLKMGLTSNDDTLPGRLINELQNPMDKRSKVPLNRLKGEYYKIRSWDREGIPSKRKLQRLKIKNWE